MTPRRRGAALACLCMLFVSAVPLHAQQSASFRIIADLIASGAGVSTSASWTARSVPGQGAVDSAASAGTILHSGYGCVLCDTASTVISAEAVTVPASIIIGSVYPNPSRGSTTIEIMNPRAAHTQVTLHTLLGTTILTVADELLPAGPSHIRLHAPELSPGSYVLRIRSGASVVQRMVIILR